ncbi:MAG: flagellar basal body-associated protein FliL [Ponticaulis sp.]|nr:flagellar basal body-associated protein FliL [Ponticaulis sp.]
MAPAKKKMAGKTLVLFVILPALLVLVGGGVGVMMLLGGGDSDGTKVASLEDDAHGEDDGHGEKDDDHGKKDDGHGKKDDSHGTADDGHGGSVKSSSELEDNGAVIQIGAPGDPSFYTMPKILVTVSSGGGRRSQLLLKLTLEASDPSVFDKLDSLLPRITDQFQMFLREMRIDDLSGSAGDYRIRRELLRRVNMSLTPDAIDAVLIEEFIVQ